MDIHPLEGLVRQYLADKDVTTRTKELYRTILKQYCQYLIEQNIAYATTSDVRRYLQGKRSQGYSTQWIYHQTSTIHGLYRYLSIHQKRLNLPTPYATDITEPVKNVRITRKIAKPILSIEQAKHLILWTKDHRKYIWQYRDHAMIYLMLTTGLRSVELRRARKKDLRIVQNQFLLYVQGKGRSSSDEFVKLAPGVQNAIREYLQKRTDKNPYLFVSHSMHSDVPYLSRMFLREMLQRVLKDCGLEHTNITPHSLRHTAATLNLLRGGTLEETRQFMRHANVTTTLLYAHHLKQRTDDAEDQLERYLLKEDPTWLFHHPFWRGNK